MNLLFSLPLSDVQRSGTITKLLRIAVIIAVLAAAFFIGIRPSLAVAIALVALVGGIIVSRYPGFSLIILIVSALSIPFALNTGAMTNVNIALIIAAGLLASWLFVMFYRHSFRLVRSSANLPVFGLAISATLSLIAGASKWNYAAVQAPVATQLGGWFLIILSLGLLLYVANRICSLAWLRWDY